MNQYRLSGPRPGLVARIAAGIAGVAVLAAAFVLGIIAWIILAGFVLMGSVALSIWFWRQRRRFEKSRQESVDSVIEAEYKVIRETRTRR